MSTETCKSIWSLVCQTRHWGTPSCAACMSVLQEGTNAGMCPDRFRHELKDNLFLAYLPANPIEEHFFPDDFREDIVDIRVYLYKTRDSLYYMTKLHF